MDQPLDVFKEAFLRHEEVVKKSSQAILPEVKIAAELIAEASKRGHKLLICGNGGSAADSQHLAAEFVCKYSKERKALPAIALTVNSSSLTAVGNDYDFDRVFVRQIEALGKKGDILVAISTSGTSKNILAAIKEAKRIGLRVIVMTGEGGSALKDEVDVAIVVPSRETARIQEIHELVYHSWCEYVDSAQIP